MIASACVLTIGSACAFITAVACRRCRTPFCFYHGAGGLCDACASATKGGRS
jgi:hypothetical protein